MVDPYDGGVRRSLTDTTACDRGRGRTEVDASADGVLVADRPFRRRAGRRSSRAAVGDGSAAGAAVPALLDANLVAGAGEDRRVVEPHHGDE